MKQKILFLDQDTHFLSSVTSALQAMNDTYISHSAEQCLELLHNLNPEILVINYSQFPELARTLIHSPKETPKVLIVSAPLTREDLINIVHWKVISYLEKPCTAFDIHKKLQLVTSLKKAKTESLSLPALGLQFYFDSRRVTDGKKTVSLSPTESKILRFLIERNSQTVTREEICDYLWSAQRPGTNVLDTHLFNLKKKVPQLEAAIKTVYGNGLFISQLEAQA